MCTGISKEILNSQLSPNLPKVLKSVVKPWVHIEWCGTTKELVKQYACIWNFPWSTYERRAHRLLLPSEPALRSSVFTLAIQRFLKMVSFH